MAVLIPSIGSCAARMTSGERRFAQRLEAKLEDDYLCWYDVAIGPANAHPDFVILHPRRGLLILEVKDWKLDTVESVTKDNVMLHAAQGMVSVQNPLEQARNYTHAVVDALSTDAQLVLASGSHQGKLTFPWSYGLVLAGITRLQFDKAALGDVWPAHRVICQDEMTESADVEGFQERLWQMFSLRFPGRLTLPQIDRIRWHMFPEIRLPVQAGLFDEPAEARRETAAADLLRIMDLQQEQLARSLGDGHRVIHGVAGSGKTLILGYRAEQLAKICARPVLVLCFNKMLQQRLAGQMREKKLGSKVDVRSFHSWCASQLRAFHVDQPPKAGDDEAFFAAMVQLVIDAVERGRIPRAQYDAVLIDEGHDFRPEWLKLITQMVNPDTRSLLLLYDDAQTIYERRKKREFSFKSVGIQAPGRTTILRLNYRNTKEILDFAALVARDVLDASDAGEDGVPLIHPVSAGRAGPQPIVINLPTLVEQARAIAAKLKQAHLSGTAWHDMAVLYRHYEPDCKAVRSACRKLGIPMTWKDDVRFGATQNTVKLMPLHSSKGLEFPLVAIPGVNLEPDAHSTDERRLLYVAMTRATQTLIVATSGSAGRVPE